jgi:hypothetical protein
MYNGESQRALQPMAPAVLPNNPTRQHLLARLRARAQSLTRREKRSEGLCQMIYAHDVSSSDSKKAISLPGWLFFTYNIVGNNIIGGGMTKMKEQKAGWKHKLFLEMTAYWINVLYLTILFAVFKSYRRLILANYDITYSNWGVSPLLKRWFLPKVLWSEVYFTSVEALRTSL